jgi:hypothetical protein
MGWSRLSSRRGWGTGAMRWPRPRRWDDSIRCTVACTRSGINACRGMGVAWRRCSPHPPLSPANFPQGGSGVSCNTDRAPCTSRRGWGDAPRGRSSPTAPTSRRPISPGATGSRSPRSPARSSTSRSTRGSGPSAATSARPTTTRTSTFGRWRPAGPHQGAPRSGQGPGGAGDLRRPDDRHAVRRHLARRASAALE